LGHWRCSTVVRTIAALANFGLLFFILYKAGILANLLETPYSSFSYHPDVDAVEILRSFEEGQEPAYKIVNPYERYAFRIRNELRCTTSHDARANMTLPLVIKSALNHYTRRDVIRQTWGQEDRFPGVVIKPVFMVGMNSKDPSVQSSIDAEQAIYGDLVQAEFEDVYFNNTFKTMLSFRWVLEHCPESDPQWFLFADDDYYVSTKNLIEFVRGRNGSSERLWTGLVFDTQRPERHHWGKWYLPLSEYPYSRFPPYVNAGAYVLSRRMLVDLYRVARFTPQFRFDDVFLGILAKKMGTRPRHSDQFRYRSEPKTERDFVGLVAAHGFHDPVRLVRTWDWQRRLGQA
ncbi:unnamed protein product, partial [Ixodes hexagonus]